MRPSGEWGIALRLIKSNLIFKMSVINAIIVGIVVLLAGFTVKEYACSLVNRYDMAPLSGFRASLQGFLYRSSILALIAATILHYLLTRRAFRPLRRLATAARQMSDGTYPPDLPQASDDEIGKLTADFNRLIRALKQNEETKKQMVADLSHDLRTPISNLTGYLEALRNGVIQGDKELYDSLYEEAVHLKNLTEQLHQLNVWEANSDRWSMGKAEVEMSGFLAAVKNTYGWEAGRNKIEIMLRAETASILVNPKGLKQIFDNLMQNAIQYNTSSWIRFSGEARNGMYIVEITNEGPLLPDEKESYLFERFYRADESRMRMGGSGLGLAIVKEIVSQSGGETGLRREGRNYTFWVALPLSQNEIQGERSTRS
ncbi:hypothetical protein SD70_20580 [Gordoniibacillus kamchatkensis]|uniref:histidine kinase n=1 Tax=Gordoniibacillus kamchatkensis TaxID=1590651 RepID=A0ABR5AG33_9BACL|nr:hypothetical protein SD70_20580 [Paenibacillus sp. VKM B-2647]